MEVCGRKASEVDDSGVMKCKRSVVRTGVGKVVDVATDTRACVVLSRARVFALRKAGSRRRCALPVGRKQGGRRVGEQTARKAKLLQAS